MSEPETADCMIPNTLNGKQAEYGLGVSISLNGFDYVESEFVYSTYGILDISPKGGPVAGATEVLVKGFGFSVNESYKAYCRFGISSDFITVPANVLDKERLICVSPGDFKIPTTVSLPLEIPLEIGFSREGADSVPWTNSDNKFRYYRNPKISSMTPSGCDVSEEVEVVVTAKGKDNFFQVITGFKSGGDIDMLHTIVCRFGDYSISPAIYIDKDTIKCVTPRTEVQAETVSRMQVQLSLSMNGQDFYRAGTFQFNGTAEGYWVLLVWLSCIMCVVIISALLSICCYYAFHRSKAYSVVQIDSGRLRGPN